MTRVAIIGCGIIGAAIAYELSQVSGLQITVLDRQAPAQGSTGAALGVLMGAISKKVKGRAWQLRQTSMQRYETLIPELEEITGQTIPFNRQGILKLCFAEDELASWEQLVQTRQSQGWHLEIWDRDRIGTRCPQLNHNQIVGAIYSPQDRQVDPSALTNALVTASDRNGVTFKFGVTVEGVTTTKNTERDTSPPTPLLGGEGSLTLSFPRREGGLGGLGQLDPNRLATSVDSKGRICTHIRADGLTLDIDWLVVAAGLGSLPLTTSLEQPVEIRPVLGQALHLRLDRFLGHPDFQPVITGNDVHIVPIGTQEYWVGATVEFPNRDGDVVAEPALLEQVKQEAITFCPALADATVLRTWSGKRPRPEGIPAPVIGPLPGYRNVLLATGHYRNGVLLAPATALAIRDAIVRRE